MANHKQNEAMIKEFYKTLNTGDVNAVMEFFSEDIVYEDAALGKMFKGLKEVTDFYQESFKVNNAGVAMPEDQGVEQTSMDVWHKTVAVNQTGVFLGMKYAIPEMRKAGYGSVVNISSTGGLVGLGGYPAYQATKGAVRILTKSAAIQYAKEKIRVNCVYPGGVNTAMAHSTTSEVMEHMIMATPMHRIAEPDEIAYGVLYLASKESSFVTGGELVIDGGFVAQ